MDGREIRDRASGLPGGDRRRNEVNDLSSMRADCYTSQKAFRFSVDQAFDCHVVTLDGGKIVVGEERTAPGNSLKWQSLNSRLFLGPADTGDRRLCVEKPGEPPFVETNRSSKDVFYRGVRLGGGNAVE